jgi:hypothetical protein
VAELLLFLAGETVTAIEETRHLPDPDMIILADPVAFSPVLFSFGDLLPCRASRLP